MNKEECLNVIKKGLNEGNLETKVFLGKFKENFQSTFDKIQKNIIVLENDGVPQNNYKEEIIDTLNMIQRIIAEDPISPNNSIFCKAWCELVVNVNNNSICSQKIEDKVHLINRFVDGHLTSLEAIETMKMLNKKLKDFKNWNPPAFEIAKHYINYLE